MLGESSETTVLEHAHRPGALAHDRRDLVHAEPADHAEQDHLGLISREARTNQRDGSLGSDHVESSCGRIVVGGTVQDVGGHGGAGSARLVPSPVDQTIPGDGEHPGAKLLLVPVEVREVSSGYEPGFGFDVLCRHWFEASEEAQQAWMQFPPQDGDRLVRAPTGSLEDLGKLGRRHVSR